MARPGGPVRWLHRLGFGKPKPEESVEFEVEHHLTEVTDHLVSKGWEVENARREAERRFGDAARYARRMKRIENAQQRMGVWASGLELGWRCAISVARMARREPAFVAGIVLTLGLGIGANATMYGIVDRLLLRAPEHIVDPEQVVRVLVEHPDPDVFGSTYPYVSFIDYLDWKAHTAMDVAAYSFDGSSLVEGGQEVGTLRIQLATPDLFPLLGVVPTIGRFFTADETSARIRTAVISHDYWEREYGADAAAVGQILTIDGRESYTIVGVAPEHFTGPELRPVDVWLPAELAAYCTVDRRCIGFRAVGRLRDGASPMSAADEATALHRQGRREMIDAGTYSGGARVILAPVIAARGPDAPTEARVAAWLAGVSLLVLLVACANVAGLLLARGAQRTPEFGVRLALGAKPGAIVAPAVIESLMLAGLGGLVAVSIARWGGEIVRSTLLPDVYFPSSTLTPRLLAFTFVSVALAGLVAGITPALHSVRAAEDRGIYRSGNARARGSRIRRALTVAQAATTVVLLVGAGLFVRSVAEVRAIDIGFDVDRLVTIQMGFAAPEPDAARRADLYREVARRMAAIPSVQLASVTSSGLGSMVTVPLRVQGVDSLPRLPGGGPYVYSVPPQYFETVGLSVLRGRSFDASDVAGGERVAVVGETTAEAVWPEGDVLDQCLMVRSRGEDHCMRIIGVVEDAARRGYFDDAAMTYYTPDTQSQMAPNTIYVRAGGEVDDVIEEIGTAIRSLPPDVRFVRVTALRDRLDPQARAWTLGATMFTVFGLLALAVAAVGLYSVLAFDVAGRTRELGIRTALGARRTRLMRSVLWQGLTLGGVGVALGLLVAYLLAPYAQDLLYETSPRDPWILGGVGAILLVVSLLASLIPGLRATRVDPMRALKTD